MHPELFASTVFGLHLQISAYRFFLFLAVAISVTGSYVLIRRSELNRNRALLALGSAVIGFFVGARILNVLLNLESFLAHPSRIYAFEASGFSEYGGLIGAASVGFLVSKAARLDIWRLGDLLAPNLGIGIAIMRIGCFLNGCCFGTETDLPWGVTFPILSDAHIHQLSQGTSGPLSVAPVHPTEIYELLAALVGSGMAVYILKKRMRPGTAILCFAVWFTAFRLCNHFLRVMPPSFTAPAWLYPAFYSAILGICLYLLAGRFAKKHHSP